MNLTSKEKLHFDHLSDPYLEDPQVQKMRSFIQHGRITTYDHCRRVALTSFWINRRLHLGSNEDTLVAGALLHDFYLYDWHDGLPCRKTHGFTHPEEARKNAVRCFDITPEMQHVIRSHMWPFTLLHIPHSREAAIVCIADKVCSAQETLFLR